MDNPNRKARVLHLFTRSDCFSIPRKLDAGWSAAMPIRNAPRWQPKSISRGWAEGSSQALGMACVFSGEFMKDLRRMMIVNLANGTHKGRLGER